MIIDAKQSNVEIYGDIQEFKTGIDPKNLEFITTLLSSNLYSAPEQSFIREIVSNAWDSHVEAGTTDVPVIVRFFKGSFYDFTVTIRDYGTGLSPERFKEVYCNIGSSTKRESNDFIGGFGIGKYSSLACSNTVYITSYYKGTAYYYVMVKSGNAITTNLLMEKATDEKDGVEVTIKNVKDIAPYKKALNYIVFFPNVFFDGKDSDFNSVRLKRFNHFAAASINIDHKLLLGNVLYPCNASHLSSDSKQFLSNITYTGIVVRFDVGEISITPNRENIIYSSDTIRKIDNRIKEAKEEIEALINAKIKRDYDNLELYYKATSKDLYYEPIKDTLEFSYSGYKIRAEDIRKLNVTFKGINLKNQATELSILYGLQVPMFKCVIYNGKVCTQKLPYRVQGRQKMNYEKLLICNSGARLLTTIKLFLRKRYDGYCVMTETDFKDFSLYIHENVFKNTSCQHEALITQGAWDAMWAKAVQIDFNTDKDYLELKAELSANKQPKELDIKEAILHVWDDRFAGIDRKSFKKFSEAVSYIKRLKKGVLLANMDVDNHLYAAVAKIRGLVFIKARKDVIKSLKELGLSCLVDFEWLCTEDKKLIEAATVNKYIPGELLSSDVAAVGKTVPKQLRQEFERILKIKKTACADYYYSGLLTNVTKYDSYTEYICRVLVEYINKYRKASAIVDCTDDQLNEILTTAVIIREKSYRVSARAYKSVRNNKLIKVLCRK